MDDAGNTKDDLKLPTEDELAKEARHRAARFAHACACQTALAPRRACWLAHPDAHRLPAARRSSLASTPARSWS
jgi:hypothetical protein